MITKFKKRKLNGILIFQILRDKLFFENIILWFFKKLDNDVIFFSQRRHPMLTAWLNALGPLGLEYSMDQFESILNKLNWFF